MCRFSLDLRKQGSLHRYLFGAGRWECAASVGVVSALSAPAIRRRIEGVRIFRRSMRSLEIVHPVEDVRRSVKCDGSLLVSGTTLSVPGLPVFISAKDFP